MAYTSQAVAAQEVRIGVVTGGTSGIAFGIAQELIEAEGFTHLVLVYLRDKEGALAAKDKLEAMAQGICVHNVQGNMADQATIDSVFAEVDKILAESLTAGRKARLAAVVHSAGTGQKGKQQKLGDGSMLKKQEEGSEDKSADLDFEDYDFYQSVYPKALMRLVEAALHGRVQEGSTFSVVAVSSPGANCTQQVPAATAYDLRGPAKATLESIVRFYAKRLAPRGITVNAVIPGVVQTKAWANITPPGKSTEELVAAKAAAMPVGRPADPREIGAMVAFLCGSRARYITGVALPVDGGAHLGY